MSVFATDSAPIFRRLKWRTRYWLSPIYPWESSLLGRLFSRHGLMAAHPDSPLAVFNWVVLAVTDHFGESLPVEFSLTPSNIKSLVAHRTDDSFDQYDGRELWHRVSKRMRQIAEPFDAQLGRSRKPHRVRIKFWLIHRNEIRVRIEEGEPLPPLEVLERRLGLNPGELCSTEVDLGKHI